MRSGKGGELLNDKDRGIIHPVVFAQQRRKMKGIAWIPADDEELIRLWDDSTLSTVQIGARLGKSKNAIIGRARRLGLPARTARKLPTRKLSAEDGPSPVGESGVTLLEIEDGQCRWHVSGVGTESHYCAQPVERGKPYCKVHCAKAYSGFP